jgi:hypothetical protein
MLREAKPSRSILLEPAADGHFAPKGGALSPTEIA